MKATTKPVVTKPLAPVVKPLAPVVKPDGLYCPECNAGPYEKATGLGSHRKRAHGVLGTSSASAEYRRKRLAEGKTVKGITTKATLITVPSVAPILMSGMPVKTECPECKKMIDTYRINGHRRVQHGVEITDDFEACPQCGRTFSHNGLGIHMKTAHGIPGKTSKYYKSMMITRVISELPVLASDAVHAGGTKGRPTNASKGLPLVKRSHHAISTLTKESVNASETAPRPTPAISAARQDNHHPTPEEEGAIAYTVGRLEAECIQQAIRFDLPPKQFTHWCIEHLQRITAR